MELSTIKQKFQRDMVIHGAEQVQQPKLAKWARQMMKVQALVRNGRLLNRFTVGCDLEFYNATGLVQTVGYLSGAVPGVIKVKPAPSRSCLEVVAGLWKALSIYNMYASAATDMLARPYQPVNRLAFGGHVHFGRRAARRVMETEALDNLTHAMIVVGLFETSLAERRLKGDFSYKKYGLPSDVRLKPWGWEYRSLPTFLGSPWMCFLTLTLAKLTVLAAPEVRKWNLVDGVPESRLRTLLARYRGVDDDAALAYWLLAQRKWPTPNTGDIRAEWSLDPTVRKPGMVWPLPRWSHPTAGWVEYTFARLTGVRTATPMELMLERKEIVGARESWQFTGWTELQTMLVGLRGRTGSTLAAHTKGPNLIVPTTVTAKDFEEIKQMVGGVKYGRAGDRFVSVLRSWVLRDAGAAEKLVAALCKSSVGFVMDGPLPKLARVKSLKVKGLLFDSAEGVKPAPKKANWASYAVTGRRSTASLNIER